MKETRMMLRNIGKINPISSMEYAKLGGYASLRLALSFPNGIVGMLKDSGLRGRGGAGFPVGLKWAFVRDTEAPQKYVICNADEGEPGTNKDRILIMGDPHAVLEGMAIAGRAVGANKGYIYVRAEYPYVRELLEKAIADAEEHNFLGKSIMGSDFDFFVEIRMGAGAYICGEETALLQSIEGLRGEPRFRPPFPAQKGLFGMPTVVNNVETFANVPLVLSLGSENFRTIGAPKTSGTKLFTLSGNICRPGVYEFQTGITIRELFEEVGGGCPNGKKLQAIQTGGASGAIISPDLLDTPMDIESCAAVGATFGAGDLMFIDEDQDLIEVCASLAGFFVDESCGKCTPCREGNKRLLELIMKFRHHTATPKDIDTINDLASTMMDASLCGLGQTSPTPIVTAVKNFPEVFERAMARRDEK
ncbi:MAG: SLBB domain-containing protein [Oscillospiraceae bacterium]|nr:SLBB domain-containing protein [Oscillospiraceae bacterium]